MLAQRSGYRDADVQIDVVAGETKRVTLTLEKLDGETKVPPVPSKPPRIVQWSMIGGGTALLVGGSLYSYFAADDMFPPAPEPLEKWYYSKPALVVAGVGGAVAVGGLVWLLVTPSSDSKPTVSLTPDGAQAGWSFTF